MAASASLNELGSTAGRIGAAGKAAKARAEIRCESGYGAVVDRRPPHCPMRRRELDRCRARRSPAVNTIVSTDRAAWAMQIPRLVEWMAWRRYLIATRASSSAPYHVREEAAWARLLDDLAGWECRVPVSVSRRRTNGSPHYSRAARVVAGS
jgi:hypothetical protein